MKFERRNCRHYTRNWREFTRRCSGGAALRIRLTLADRFSPSPAALGSTHPGRGPGGGGRALRPRAPRTLKLAENSCAISALLLRFGGPSALTRLLFNRLLWTGRWLGCFEIDRSCECYVRDALFWLSEMLGMLEVCARLWPVTSFMGRFLFVWFIDDNGTVLVFVLIH